MAQALSCDLCAQETAQLVITNSDNGDVIAVGPSCVVVFYLTAAGEMLAMMPAENVRAYAKVLAPVLDRMAEFADYDLDAVTAAAADGADGDAQAPAPVGEAFGD